MGRLKDAIDRIHELDVMKCPECGAQLNFQEDQDFCYCSYCGTQVYKTNKNEKRIIYHKIDDARIKEAEVKDSIHKRIIEDEKYQRDVSLKVLIGLCVFIFLMIFMLHIEMTNSEKEYQRKVIEAEESGLISAGYHGDYENRNVSVVVAEIEAIGFSNIKTIELNDVLFFSKDKNMVDSISIKGNSSFQRDDYFDPSDKVIISYH